ncbi:uncharacterized protein LOC114755976 [Neltuma alba]|uniref:uncharacterized protein LOC114755976 n=1 Tax=Neltuma alba TaxID=207710 RepID=UPI0010A2DC89|nr:uncharacterized protein LOC114755976 [Prosopis alba]
MSADDIQKAKMRAVFMQSKYGKPGSSKGSKEAKTDGLNKPQTNQAGLRASSSKVPVSTKTDEDSQPLLLPSKNFYYEGCFFLIILENGFEGTFLVEVQAGANPVEDTGRGGKRLQPILGGFSMLGRERYTIIESAQIFLEDDSDASLQLHLL